MKLINKSRWSTDDLRKLKGNYERYRCSFCREKGHNAVSCPEILSIFRIQCEGLSIFKIQCEDSTRDTVPDEERTRIQSEYSDLRNRGYYRKEALNILKYGKTTLPTEVVVEWKCPYHGCGYSVRKDRPSALGLARHNHLRKHNRAEHLARRESLRQEVT